VTSQITEKFILDATAGFRMMWSNKKHPNTVYLDERYECEPDIVGDFRELKQFTDETFRLIVFDPPHIIRGTQYNSTGMLNDFGCLQPETWQVDLQKAFKELWRVLKPFGVLIFKWSTQQISTAKLKKFFPAEPLFYQVTSNKRREKSHSDYQTLWFCFMKLPTLTV